MSVALVIVVAAVLFVILFVLFIIFVGVREPRAGRKQTEAGDRVRAGEAEAQHERSQSRQAGVKAAYAEDSSKVGSDAASRDAPSRTSAAGDS
jgi:flagellar biosynthesis/type III secretory pathway M-ring protein FliF/YscJ